MSIRNRRPEIPPPRETLDQDILRALTALNWRLRWHYKGLKPDTESQARAARFNFGAALLVANKLRKLLEWKMRYGDLPGSGEEKSKPGNISSIVKIIRPKPEPPHP